MSDAKREDGIQTPPQGSQVPLAVLIRGTEKTFDNAERLYVEADILANAGAVARALCLHQISLEECAKVNNLGAWAVSLVFKFDVNQKKILAAFGYHAAKNNSNAYMLRASEAETDAWASGDSKAAMEAFKKTQNEFHQTSNGDKNTSLYVDWVGSEFSAPSERITNEMLAVITERNAEFLGYAYNMLGFLRQLEKSQDKMKEKFSSFVEQVEKLGKEKPEDFFKAIETLLAGFLEAGMQKQKD